MKPDPEKLRQIARAARPSGQDDADPEIVEARDALSKYPEILKALEAERREDLKIASEYREMELPDALEDRLIGALREARREAGSSEVKIVRASFSRRAWLGSAAAALAFAAGGGLWWRSRMLPLDQLVDRLAKESRQGVKLSLMSMQTDEVVEWLEERDAPRAESLPPKLEALGRKGCHIYDIEGHRVSLECFLLPGMRELHLFTTPSSGLRGEPATEDGLLFRTEGELTAALWSQGAQTMLLFSDVGESELARVLSA